jgi:3-hydroxy acid dehydrogenase / malonic semialdehyde reductase
MEAHGQSGIQAGGKFAAVQMDIAKLQDVQSLWTKVPEELRQVDILGKRCSSCVIESSDIT